ncbi:hypothetical protein niasHT_015320 [Heterodera trifolii]|uniref:RING-type domain-containing protein n=1 Tax=Heterodera trifolii TaxID=157864 RepID=A0ABD2KZN1_9BILA
MNLGRCSICTLSFDLNDVSALKCGHTYHYQCIDKWIANSKTCPNCRTSNLKRDILKLFFDEGEKSFSQFVQEPANSELLAQLKEAQDVKCVLEKTIKEQHERLTLLEYKLKQQKTKGNELNMQIQRKAQHIATLESQLFDQKVLKETNEKYKRRLITCEFYDLLMRSGGDEGKIDKYINQNGHPDEAKFLDLMRKQRDEEVKKNKIIIVDLRKERLEHCKKQKENDELRKEIEQLRAILEDRGKKRRVDGKAGTSKNSAPNRPRSSFGFSFVEPDDKGQIVHAAKNFAFEGDSSVEFLSASSDKKAPCPSHLEQFDPLFHDGKKKSPQFASSAKKGSNRMSLLQEELSEVFSPNLLAHAKKANI